MEINELLRLGVEVLKDKDFSNPQLESRLILSKLLNVDISYLYAHGDEEVSLDIGQEFRNIINKRACGYPFQYLIKYKEFMGLDFYIEEGVLIPRPDTEILVEYVLDYISRNHHCEVIKVLDIGSGSGAISLSIAHYAPNSNVYGVDIGDIPIKIANINKERFNLNNVDFIKGNLFEPFYDKNLSFNIIVSNPPYIPSLDIEDLQTEVKDYEPRLALDGGQDGLDFYRRITKEAKDFLAKDGLLIFEIGYNQASYVKSLLEDRGFINIEIIRDLQGLDRVVLGRL
ncbi:MAG: peptide chain release factor N(5)-glutamine methyltransferase [Tissierellia bacterium]|nr:peptide chain release factor N(5)-glutamine methyltransferase [Tissierellia bacterium]